MIPKKAIQILKALSVIISFCFECMIIIVVLLPWLWVFLYYKQISQLWFNFFSKSKSLLICTFCLSVSNFWYGHIVFVIWLLVASLLLICPQYHLSQQYLINFNPLKVHVNDYGSYLRESCSDHLIWTVNERLDRIRWLSWYVDYVDYVNWQNLFLYLIFYHIFLCLFFLPHYYIFTLLPAIFHDIKINLSDATLFSSLNLKSVFDWKLWTFCFFISVRLLI